MVIVTLTTDTSTVTITTIIIMTMARIRDGHSQQMAIRNAFREPHLSAMLNHNTITKVAFFFLVAIFFTIILILWRCYWSLALSGWCFKCLSLSSLQFRRLYLVQDFCCTKQKVTFNCCSFACFSLLPTP